IDVGPVVSCGGFQALLAPDCFSGCLLQRGKALFCFLYPCFGRGFCLLLPCRHLLQLLSALRGAMLPALLDREQLLVEFGKADFSKTLTLLERGDGRHERAQALLERLDEPLGFGDGARQIAESRLKILAGGAASGHLCERGRVAGIEQLECVNQQPVDRTLRSKEWIEEGGKG